MSDEKISSNKQKIIDLVLGNFLIKCRVGLTSETNFWGFTTNALQKEIGHLLEEPHQPCKLHLMYALGYYD